MSTQSADSLRLEREKLRAQRMGKIKKRKLNSGEAENVTDEPTNPPKTEAPIATEPPAPSRERVRDLAPEPEYPRFHSFNNKKDPSEGGDKDLRISIKLQDHRDLRDQIHDPPHPMDLDDDYRRRPNDSRRGPRRADPPEASGSSRGSRGARTTKQAPPKEDPSDRPKNDYSQHFVDSGERPQNFVRDSCMQDRFEEYPILKDLLEKKDALIQLRNPPPFYLNVDLGVFDLAELKTTFDVILIDPPWEEYYVRSLGHTPRASDLPILPNGDKGKPFWSMQEIEKLNIAAVAANPCFVFLWTGNGGEGLEQGRDLLRKWGFRRSEDIVWVKTNKENAQSNMLAARDQSSTFLRTKEHCLMGIHGSVRRNTDAHIIHSNIDTDVVIAEEPKLGSTRKPEEIYHIIEHFCLGRRRLELFGEDHNIRSGWVTLGNNISSSKWSSETYNQFFEPLSMNGHLLGTTTEIENLRPKSPKRDDSKLIYYNPNKKISNRGPPDKDVEIAEKPQSNLRDS